MSSDGRVSSRVPICVAAGVALLAFAVYLPALRNGFVDWDDDMYVVENPDIRSFGAGLLRWAFLGLNRTGNWHPLTWISHALDYAFWGLNPLGHHLTSIVLHGVNTGLVVLVVFRLLQLGTQKRTGDVQFLVTSGITGFLFGLHPLHVESVAWVSERKDVLSSLFFLLSILAYLRAVAAPTAGGAATGPRMISRRHYWLAVLAALLALLGKPMAVTLPAVLLVLDWYPLRRITSGSTFAAAIREKLPFIVMSIAVATATVLLHRAVNAVAPSDAVPFATRTVVAVRALFLYLAKMVWPAGLLPFYSYPVGAKLFEAWSLASFAALGAVTIACLIAARRGVRFWLAAWAVYIIMLLPVLGLVQVGSQAMADRYTYLPSIPPFLLAGLAAARLVLRPRQEPGSRITFRAVPSAFLLVPALLLAALTVRQIGVWHDGITLWNQVLDHDPAANAMVANNNRAIAYLNQGRLDEALSDFTKAIAAAPASDELYYRRGAVLLRKGDLDASITDFTAAIARNPASSSAYRSRGLAYLRKGLYAEAAQDLDRALALNPADADALNYRGIVLGKLGSQEEALVLFDRALSLRPGDAGLHENRGITFLQMGRNGRAIDDLTKAIGQGKGGTVYLYRGMAFERSGRIDRADADYGAACSAGVRDGCLRRARLVRRP